MSQQSALPGSADRRPAVTGQVVEAEQGILPKYRVERLSDPAGKHDKCEYFVLDPQHDPFARAALYAYIKSCRATHPALAEDLQKLLDDTLVGG